jgi:hypothetical protein
MSHYEPVTQGFCGTRLFARGGLPQIDGENG